jgi:hypothetical protein
MSRAPGRACRRRAGRRRARPWVRDVEPGPDERSTIFAIVARMPRSSSFTHHASVRSEATSMRWRTKPTRRPSTVTPASREMSSPASSARSSSPRLSCTTAVVLTVGQLGTPIQTVPSGRCRQMASGAKTVSTWSRSAFAGPRSRIQAGTRRARIAASDVGESVSPTASRKRPHDGAERRVPVPGGAELLAHAAGAGDETRALPIVPVARGDDRADEREPLALEESFPVGAASASSSRSATHDPRRAARSRPRAPGLCRG